MPCRPIAPRATGLPGVLTATRALCLCSKRASPHSARGQRRRGCCGVSLGVAGEAIAKAPRSSAARRDQMMQAAAISERVVFGQWLRVLDVQCGERHVSRTVFLCRSAHSQLCPHGVASRAAKNPGWCPWRESNPHSLRNTILSRARLPVPPHGLAAARYSHPGGVRKRKLRPPCFLRKHRQISAARTNPATRWTWTSP